MKKIFPFILLCLMAFSFWGFRALHPAQFPEKIALYESHNRYKEPLLKERRFKHTDIVPLLNAL
ncbi:MAG: peptidase M14, partial [Saprospiraceae bacterium]